MAPPTSPTTGPEPDFDTIAPLSVQPAPRAAPASPPWPSPSSSPGAGGVPLRAVGLGLVGLLGVTGVLWWGLARSPSADSVPATRSEVPAAATVASTPGTPAEAVPSVEAPTRAAGEPEPWDDPDLLRARQQAQALAEQVAARRERLQPLGVARWAPQPFAEAEAQAAQAAAQFTSRAFPAAAASYGEADTLLAALEAEVPQRREQALTALRAAVDAGDAEAAAAARIDAEALAAGDARLPPLMARLAALPTVQAALAQAARAEQAGDDATAKAAYQSALAADAASPTAREGLQRLQARERGRAFEQALGAALAALDEGRLAEARSALSRAAALRPDDPGLRAAQRRLQGLQDEAELSAALQSAESAAMAEAWTRAVQAFEAALKIDPSRVAAQQGLARAREQAALFAALEAVRDAPERLASAGPRDRAAALLEQARQVSSPGPRLQERIAAVAALLQAASTPVPVRLMSDEQTAVTLYRVGEQGRFRARELSLLPGRYVAVGVRPGYQDVRVEFEVRAGEPAQVQIQTEVRL